MAPVNGELTLKQISWGQTKIILKLMLPATGSNRLGSGGGGLEEDNFASTIEITFLNKIPLNSRGGVYIFKFKWSSQVPPNIFGGTYLEMFCLKDHICTF